MGWRNNVEHMWEQMKQAMVEKSEELCGSVKVECGNPKSVWWNNQVKSSVKRKEVLGTRDEDARERCLEAYKEEKRKVKRCIYQSKEEVQEQFGMKMNQDVNENREMFWKEVTKVD